ncbi:hypothetical protein ACJRPK_13825 [Aquimarina sp. 2-A2]|uniref:hypothetical protein n=1 Tax=Aquimarina sp. 2-A2 TaxID=3382644 RepID=UPI00387F1349
MANNAFVEYVSKQTLEEGQKAITQLNQMIEKIGIIGVEAQKVRFPSESKKIISDVNKELVRSKKVLSDAEVAQKRYENAQRNYAIATSKAGKETTLLQKKTAAAKRETRSLADEYTKLRLKLNKATLAYQNLAAKQGLSNSATIKAQKEVQRLRGKIDAINKPIKVMGDNVGNYPNKFGLATNAIKGLIGAFGLIEGVRLAFNFTKESIQLAKEAKGVEFAFVRLGEEGRRAFESVKKSTRGLLSDLDIKRSLVDFDNFNLSLTESDTLFEFLAVRAAQTGKSIDSLKDSLVEGLSKESKLRIDNLGISAAELNAELEKTPDFVQAVANIAKREVKEAGSILDDAANSSEQWAASVENLKVAIGQLSTDTKGIDFLGFFVGIVDDLTNGFKNLKTGIQGITQGFNDFIEPVKVLLNDFPLLQKFTSFLGDQFSKLYEVLSTTTLSRIGLAFKVLGATLSGLGNVVKTLKESFIDFFASFESFKNIDFSNPLKAVKQIGTAFANVAKSSKEEAKDLVTAFREGFVNAMKPIEQTSERLEINKNKIVENKEEVGKLSNVVKGSIASFEQLISVLRKEQNEVATSTERYRELQFRIDDVRRSIDALKGIEADDLSKGIEIDFDLPENKEIIDELTKRNEQLKSLYREDKGNWQENWTEKLAIAQDATAAISDIVSVSFDRRIVKIEEEIEANEVATEAKLRNFRGTDEERQQIEEAAEQRRNQLNKKLRQEQIKQAKFKKALDLTQAVIAGAAATVAALKDGIPAAILTAALAAVQIGVIAAQPIPQYKHGKGANDNYEGAAVVGDGGRKEVIYNPKTKKVQVTPSTPTVTNVLKDDMVFSSLGAFDDYSKNNLMLNDPIMTSKYAPSLITPDTVNTTIDVLMSDFNSRMEEKIERGIKKGFKSVNLIVDNGKPAPDISELLRRQRRLDV